MDIDEALDRVYQVSLDEFTATRNELAKQLSGTDAARVKALKKPNLAAWALNQLARKHPDALDELFAATDRLRVAQRRVLSGGRATDLRTATDERNAVVAKLTKLAEAILTESGHAAAGTTLSAVSDSFVAVATDQQGAEQLRAGRLEREIKASSIVDVGGLTLVPDSGEERTDTDVPDPSAVHAAREAVTEARERLAEAKYRAKKASSESRKLEHEADEAARRAHAAREAAEFARRAADARAAEVEEAEKTLADAQAALKKADRR